MTPETIREFSYCVVPCVTYQSRSCHRTTPYLHKLRRHVVSPVLSTGNVSQTPERSESGDALYLFKQGSNALSPLCDNQLISMYRHVAHTVFAGAACRARIHGGPGAAGLLVRGLAVKVGDTVPVNYMKDEKPPTIKPDADYPAWLFGLTDKLPSKTALLSKIDKGGVESLTEAEMTRTKRLITLETIKMNNLASKTGG